jgi:hypothetical protein
MYIYICIRIYNHIHIYTYADIYMYIHIFTYRHTYNMERKVRTGLPGQAGRMCPSGQGCQDSTERTRHDMQYVHGHAARTCVYKYVYAFVYINH